MREKVTFKKVIANNWKSLVNLDLGAGRGDIVASNLYSTDEAQFDPDAHPRVVYTEKRDVGFMIYDVKKTKVKAPEASIYHFMIDRKNQDKDYGRSVLSKALEKIRMITGMNIISIRYMSGNLVAKSFSTIFGFVEMGS